MLDAGKCCIKAVEVKESYNFVVVDLFILNHLGYFKNTF